MPLLPAAVSRCPSRPALPPAAGPALKGQTPAPLWRVMEAARILSRRKKSPLLPLLPLRLLRLPPVKMRARLTPLMRSPARKSRNNAPSPKGSRPPPLWRSWLLGWTVACPMMIALKRRSLLLAVIVCAATHRSPCKMWSFSCVLQTRKNMSALRG